MAAPRTRDITYRSQTADRPIPDLLNRPPTPPPHENLIQTVPSNHDNTHNQPNALVLNLPFDVLILILKHLDQLTLELLRRTSHVFLAALPGLYPRLFSRELQGASLPWPVRRPWTLGAAQRRELLRLVAYDKGSSSSGVVTAPIKNGQRFSWGGGGGRCEGMVGLKKAWRYVSCVDCGRFHPPPTPPRPPASTRRVRPSLALPAVSAHSA